MHVASHVYELQRTSDVQHPFLDFDLIKLRMIIGSCGLKSGSNGLCGKQNLVTTLFKRLDHFEDTWVP